MSRNPINHNRTKTYRHLLSLCQGGFWRWNHYPDTLPSKDVVADLLTSPIQRDEFQMMGAGLGLKTLTN